MAQSTGPTSLMVTNAPDTPATNDSPDRTWARASPAIFLFFFCVYLLTYKGMTVGDDLTHLISLKSWIESGTLYVPDGWFDPQQGRCFGFFMASGRDGHAYLRLPPGLALASMPTGLTGALVEAASGRRSVIPDSAWLCGPGKDVAQMESTLRALRRQPLALSAGLVNPIATAVTLALFLSLVTWIGCSRRAGLSATALLGLATIVWPYATTYWSQPVATLCILGTVAGLFRFEQSGRRAPLIWSGAFCGYGVLTRTELILAVPWALLFFVLAVRKRRARWWPALTAFGVPLLACASLWLGWNWLRFGAWLQTGAIHQRAAGRVLLQSHLLLQSVPAQLASFQRSIFVYSPPLLLAVVAAPTLWRRTRSLCVMAAGIGLTLFAFFSTFAEWTAPASWGPRFLVPLTPLLMLPLAGWLDGARWRRAVALALACLGIALQLVVVLPGPRLDTIQRYWGSDSLRVIDLFFRSDIVPQAAVLLHGEVDPWWLWNRPAFAAGVFLLVVALVAAARAVAATTPRWRSPRTY